MNELGVNQYARLTGDLRGAGFDYWYSSPELWVCQDYPIIYDQWRLMNENGVLLIPPLKRGKLDYFLNKHIEEVGYCDILFAPHNIEKLIHPPLFNKFEVEQTDNNYINSTELVHNLKGNKLKKLRNNVNNFKESIEVRPLALEDVPAAIKLVEKYHGVNPDFDDIAYNTKILDSMIRFKVIRIGYWLDGEMVAFNIGAPLSSLTMAFLISKSRHDIKYLVDYVRWDFHAFCYGMKYVFVNDGSDLDSKGLAQLKKKFAPVSIQSVYGLEWKG